MATTTEKYPLTGDETELNELLMAIARDQVNGNFINHPLQQAFDIITELRDRLVEAKTERDRYIDALLYIRDDLCEWDGGAVERRCWDVANVAVEGGDDGQTT